MLVDLIPAQCEDILKKNMYAHLGCIDNDQPYVLPITYVYKDGYLYSFSLKGHKVDIMKKHPQICMQVEHVVSGFEWQSVMCCGIFEEVTDPKIMQDIRILLEEQHGQVVLQQGEVPVSALAKNFLKDISETVIYRMKPTRVTGKAETKNT